MYYDELALQQVRERRLLIDQCDAWLFDTISPYIGQRVLEVGCGLGNLVYHLKDRNLVVGVDNNADSVNHVNKTFHQYPNITATAVDAADQDFLALKRYRFDSTVSLNVLEHIEDDEQVLANIHDVLMPGGRLVLIVPAHMFLYGSMDRSIGHFRRYTTEDLRAKLARSGFEVLQQRYLNLIGALGWYVNGSLLRRQVPPVGQLKLFNKMMPLVTALESHVNIPFGLSLLSVSRKIR